MIPLAILAVLAIALGIYLTRRRPGDPCAGCGGKIEPPATYFCDDCWEQSWW